jgi:RimJ/RimL family protein N-acetyltransferase
MRIDTRRLMMRHVVEEDAKDIYAYCKHPEVGPRAGWVPHTSIENTRELIAQVFIGQPHVFGIIDDSNRMIGSVGFLPDPHRPETNVFMLGFALARECWGKGYMTEAARAVVAYGFDTLGVPLLTSNTYDFNAASQKVLKHCGFELEGMLHAGETRYDGKTFDLQMFYLTYERFNHLRRE